MLVFSKFVLFGVVLVSLYEYHDLTEDFPIILHLDTLKKNSYEQGISNWHENIELLYCIKGNCRVVINGDIINMEEGGVAVINSGRIHYTAIGTDEVKYYCLIIDTHFLRKFGLSIEDAEIEEYITDDVVTGYFKSIVKEYESENSYYKNIVKGNIISLASYLFREYAHEQKKSVNNDAIKNAIKFIRENIGEDISVEDISKHAGFSRFHFSRRFKAVVGCTINEYLQLIRCREAKSMLLTGRYMISEVAAACGFSDVSYFTKVFKNHFGILPSKLKQ